MCYIILSLIRLCKTDALRNLYKAKKLQIHRILRHWIKTTVLQGTVPEFSLTVQVDFLNMELVCYSLLGKFSASQPSIKPGVS